MRKTSRVIVQEAVDGIDVDVDERDWMARPLAMLGTSNAPLMHEHLMNRHDTYGNGGGPQRAEISSTRRSNAADNANWTVKVDARITARGGHFISAISRLSVIGRGAGPKAAAQTAR